MTANRRRLQLPRLADLASFRAAWWTYRAVRAVRSALGDGKVRDIALPWPPPLPSATRRVVEAVLRRRRATCLEGALVRQRWLTAHGVRREVAIGVTSPSQGFMAHAWLVGEEDPLVSGYHELTRLAP